MRRSMGVLHADLGLVRTEEQVPADARRVEDRTAELLGAGISWCPGARELFTAVRATGLRTALVTTTPRRLADIVLTTIRADLGADPFDVIVGGDEVPTREPDPAPYRQAMAELAVTPDGCIGIEDSEFGVVAGLAAGAAVLGVPTVQELAPAPGLTLRNGLAGVDVAELADVLAARPPADVPA